MKNKVYEMFFLIKNYVEAKALFGSSKELFETLLLLYSNQLLNIPRIR